MILKKISEQLGLDETTCHELVRLLLTTSTSDLDKLKSALQLGNSEAIQTSAHSIKGAAANMGFNDLSQIAAKAEQEGATGKTSNIHQAIQDIANELSRIENLLP